MNRIISTVTLALLAIGTCGPAFAQSAQRADDKKIENPQVRTGSNAVRDWAAIDTNKDNLISPEEMETALKEVGPQAKPAKK